MQRKFSTRAKLTGDATAAHVRSGKTFYNTDSKNKVTGTMPDYAGLQVPGSAISASGGNLQVRSSEYGYFNRDSRLTYPLSNFGDAIRSEVLSGKKFTSASGLNLTGTMVNKGGTSTSAAGSKSGNNFRLRIPENGFYNTNSYLTYPMADFGTAIASNMLAGKTFTSSSGLKIEGTMANNGTVTETINPGETYKFTQGYYNGASSVTAAAASLTHVDINMNKKQPAANMGKTTSGVLDTTAKKKKMRYALAGYTYSGSPAVTISLQGSNNNSTWTTIKAATSNADSDGMVSMSGESSSYQYYRAVCNQDGSCSFTGCLYCA